MKKLIAKSLKGYDVSKIPYKNKPNIVRVVANLWDSENRFKLGYNKKTDLWYPYKTSNGNLDVGNGIDLDLNPQYKARAYKGMTKLELTNLSGDLLRKEYPIIMLKMSLYTNRPDTISPQMTEGLLDMYWLIKNGIYGYNNLFEAIAKGDLKNIKEESKVYFTPGSGVNTKGRETKNGKVYDETRHNRRILNYFNYD